jgi:hypothetical protein
MLFIAYIVGLIISIVLVYMAGKQRIFWLQIVLVLALVLATAIGAGNAGIEIGKSSSESQFYSVSQRTIGMAFCQMSDEGNRGETEVLVNKVNHLCELWRKTKFYEEDGGESLAELCLILLDTGKVQPVDTDNPDNPPLNSKNQLDD